MIVEQFDSYSHLSHRISSDAALAVMNIEDVCQTTYRSGGGQHDPLYQG